MFVVVCTVYISYLFHDFQQAPPPTTLQFEDVNKGFEGIYYFEKGGKRFFMGLCESALGGGDGELCHSMAPSTIME